MGVRRVFAAAAALAALAPAQAVPAAQPGMAFSLDISLSPQAAAKLAVLKEGISIAATFYGDPTPAAKRHADEMGQIGLGNERVTISGTGGTARITGRTVDSSHLSWIKGRSVQVNVNVFSARRSGPDNILDCDIYEGPVAAAAASPRPIRCKLIGEP